MDLCWLYITYYILHIISYMLNDWELGIRVSGRWMEYQIIYRHIPSQRSKSYLLIKWGLRITISFYPGMMMYTSNSQHARDRSRPISVILRPAWYILVISSLISATWYDSERKSTEWKDLVLFILHTLLVSHMNKVCYDVTGLF